MNVQWLEIPFYLQSQFQGGISINQLTLTEDSVVWETGPQWVTDPTGCQAGSAKRVTRDNSPQTGGEIVHRHFKTGVVFQLKLLAVDVTTPDGDFTAACGQDLVTLDDQLMRILDGMENTDGFLWWVPSGYPSEVGAVGRCMFGARWLGPDGLGGAAFTAALEARDTDIFTTVQFALLCPFPYVLDIFDATPPTTGFKPPIGYGDPESLTLDNGFPVELDQYGTTDMFPVLHLYGPLAATNPVTLSCINAPDSGSVGEDATFLFIYNPALPDALLQATPGGSPLEDGYAINPSGVCSAIEINMFANTAYFNSNADGGVPGEPSTYVFNGPSALAGMDVTTSDFWSLCANYDGGDNANAVEMDSPDETVTADIVWAYAYV